ncbi:hypothetical protein ES705_25471 [subsurface metagenome]
MDRGYHKDYGFSVRCVKDIDTLAISLNGTDVTSIEGTDGSIDLTVSGGLSPYTYNWSNSATTEDLTGLSSGVYSVTVTDSLNNTAIDSIRIYDTFLDVRDGTIYEAVTIGSQIWMAENLNVGTYVESINTGSAHSDVSDNSIIEKYCYENNEAYCDTFGGLYDWNEMMQYVTTERTNGICPDGWHLPSDAEWKQLEMYLGMTQAEADNTGWRGTDEGGKLKEISTTYWVSPNTGATNESGFTALPFGYRLFFGSFADVGLTSYFHSSTESGSSNAWDRYMNFNISQVYRNIAGKTEGFSVRCVRNICLDVELVFNATNVTCNGDNDGIVDLTVSGGTSPFTFSWSNGETTEDISGLTAGKYYVTLTDSNACITVDSVTITEPAPVPAPIANDTLVCYGDPVPDLTAIGNDIKWYSDPELSVLEHTGFQFSTVDTSINIYTYYVTQTIDGCESLHNTVTLSILYCVSDYPYKENFENGESYWLSAGTNSSWEWGVPDGPTINSAASGDSAWVTNLFGNHNNNELSFVYSPVFDFTGFSEPYISMSIWYDCQYGRDGANLQYSTAGGNTWQVVGDKYDNEMEGWNWYNNDTITGLLEGFDSILYAKGWTGENNGARSDGWINATHDLPGLGGLSNVRFRFVFGSDSSIVNDGFAFDSICIGAKNYIISTINPVAEKTSKLKIYPNPFTGTTTIEFPNPGNDNYKLTVTDLTGKTVRIIDNITGNQVIFNREELPVGFYLIELRGKKRYIGKMFIE